MKLVFRVPVEMPEGEEANPDYDFSVFYNEKVVTSFPSGFKPLKCFSTDDFKCKINKGRKVTWTRRNSSEDAAEVDLFKVSVKTPKLHGTYESRRSRPTATDPS